MAYDDERRCVGCGDTEEMAHLERCMVCGKWFCPDCAFKQTGRRFCSGACAKDFFWGDYGDEDDTKELPPDHEL